MVSPDRTFVLFVTRRIVELATLVSAATVSKALGVDVPIPTKPLVCWTRNWFVPTVKPPVEIDVVAVVVETTIGNVEVIAFDAELIERAVVNVLAPSREMRKLRSRVCDGFGPTTSMRYWLFVPVKPPRAAASWSHSAPAVVRLRRIIESFAFMMSRVAFGDVVPMPIWPLPSMTKRSFVPTAVELEILNLPPSPMSSPIVHLNVEPDAPEKPSAGFDVS